MSHSIRREANCKDDKNNGLFACINTFRQSGTDWNKINLSRKDDSKDVSSHACFLPIAKKHYLIVNNKYVKKKRELQNYRKK